jgi:lysophospholipase L1-like esterase
MREIGPRRRALARGLRSRSLLIILAAALLALAALAGLQWFVASGTFTVIPERLMLRIPNDDYVHVSYRIAELKRTPPTTPVVYLFGGSGTLEMIRSEGALAAAISADAGTTVRVVTLAAHAQSMGQTLAIIDNLPRGRGLLAIGLSPNRFTAAPGADASQISGSPLALTSPRLSALLAGRTSLHKRLPGVLTGTFDFVLAYLNQRVISKSPDLLPITYAGHYFTDGPVASISAKTSGQAVELARERPQYAANIAYNLAALTAVVRLGREKGYNVAFFEQPLGPEASGPAWSAYLAGYRADVARAARPLGVPTIDVQPHAGLRNEDFADLFHLVNSGRDKWTPLIARALAVVLRQGG